MTFPLRVGKVRVGLDSLQVLENGGPFRSNLINLTCPSKIGTDQMPECPMPAARQQIVSEELFCAQHPHEWLGSA